MPFQCSGNLCDRDIEINAMYVRTMPSPVLGGKWHPPKPDVFVFPTRRAVAIVDATVLFTIVRFVDGKLTVGWCPNQFLHAMIMCTGRCNIMCHTTAAMVYLMNCRQLRAAQ